MTAEQREALEVFCNEFNITREQLSEALDTALFNLQDDEEQFKELIEPLLTITKLIG